jgi:hypothetical protein
VPNSQAPAHWSKDLVEHLRTVHFALTALCVGLICLALFSSKSEIEIAHDQGSEILWITSKDNWQSDLLETAARNIAIGHLADCKNTYSIVAICI